jgi:acetate kinase
MEGVDVVVFTGGIGENADDMRSNIMNGFEYLGLEFDDAKNKGVRGKEIELTKDSSKVKVWIVPTDEELVIARDTYEIVKALKK